MRHDRRIRVRADVMWQGTVVEEDLPVLDVSVSCDGASETRRSLQRLTIEGLPGLIPRNSASHLSGYGAEVAIYGGYSDDLPLSPAGVFRIDETSVEHDPGSLTITVDGKDRSSSVDIGGFWTLTTVNPGDNLADRIEEFIDKVLPGVATDIVRADYTAPVLLVWEEGDSPWRAIREMAASIGMEAFFDRSGTFVLRRIPTTVNTPASINYRVGEDHVKRIRRTFSTRQGYNRYVVIGQNTAREPVRGDAMDTTPGSPTEYGGPFGKRSAPIIRDEKVGSVRQAQAAAAGWLARDRGGTEEVEVTVEPDWSREAGEVGSVRDPALYLNDPSVIEGFTVTPKEMTVRMAAKKTAVEENVA